MISRPGREALSFTGRKAVEVYCGRTFTDGDMPPEIEKAIVLFDAAGPGIVPSAVRDLCASWRVPGTELHL